MICCQHCGYPIYDYQGEILIRLSVNQRRIFAAVSATPQSLAELHGAVYGLVPELRARSPQTVRHQIYQLNLKLAPFGLRVRGRGGLYRIERIARARVA